jgi:GTP-binding protein
MKIDLEFMQMLGREGVPFGIVFTKSDKLSARQLRLNVEAYKKRLSEWWEELPNIFITSSEHRKGRDEILDFIEECLKDC